MTEVDNEAVMDLVETLCTVVNEFVAEHPEIPVDVVAMAVSYFQGSIFRLASEIPPSKLH